MREQEEIMWELKQTAKWSLGLRERKHAIKDLARMYPEGAIHALLEIKNTAVHEEIRKACVEAIKSVAPQHKAVSRKQRAMSKAKKRKGVAG